jgi:leucyl/phenylalanyl-tRNA---protein transferase
MLIPPFELLKMYRAGRFPMAEGNEGAIYIYDPDPRGIIDPEHFHLPSSLKQTIRTGKFSITINTAFERVIAECADRAETWISDDIKSSYINLYRLGHAHSVEAWRDGTLAGGLYGVAIQGAFFGESMFSRVRDASKVALAALVERMRDRGMVLLDTQFVTPHLERFGAREIRREEYRERLRLALALPVQFYP